MELSAAFRCREIKWQYTPVESRQDAIRQPQSKDLALPLVSTFHAQHPNFKFEN